MYLNQKISACLLDALRANRRVFSLYVTMGVSLLILLLLSVFCLVPGQSAIASVTADGRDDETYTVPLEYDRLNCTRPVVYMRFGNEDEFGPPIPILLDTALPGLMLSKEAAKMEHLKLQDIPADILHRTTYGGDKYTVVKTLIFSNTKGDICLRGQADYVEIEVADFSPFRVGHDIKIMGVCGISMLRSFKTNLVMDFGVNTLSVTKMTDPLPMVGPGAHRVPFRFDKDIVRVTGTLLTASEPTGKKTPENYTASFKVDTGSWYSVLNAEAPLRRVYPVALAPDKLTTFATQGSISAENARVRGFQMETTDGGEWSEDNVDVTFGPQDSRAENILGLSFLSRFRLTFDFKHNVLTFEPSSKQEEARRPLGNLGGLGLNYIGEHWIVTKIHTWSELPRQGVQVGDEVISVNGINLLSQTRAAMSENEYLWGIVSGYAGDDAVFELKSADTGKTYTVKFKRGSVYDHGDVAAFFASEIGDTAKSSP